MSLIILTVYQSGAEIDPVFDLIIYHHGSLSGPMMEYIGGETMEIDGLHADKLCFWDLINALEDYLEYEYNDIPKLHYKYYDQSNEEIHDLTTNQDFMTMITWIIDGGRRKLHVFVDHELEETVEPVSIEMVAPMLLISQAPLEVEINYSEEDVTHHTSQPQAHKLPQQSARQP
jgi:hypothetical protein